MTAPQVAGKMKSNIPICMPVMSAATATTSRLVEVPMVVLMPPIRVDMPIGINIPELLVLVRIDTEIRIGSNNTTIGVLFKKALNIAPISRVASNDSIGAIRHNFASVRPIGSSAPVLTRP